MPPRLRKISSPRYDKNKAVRVNNNKLMPRWKVHEGSLSTRLDACYQAHPLRANPRGLATVWIHLVTDLRTEIIPKLDPSVMGTRGIANFVKSNWHPLTDCPTHELSWPYAKSRLSLDS